ncbi:putative HTH-type transcriptional regulator YdfH [Marinomonas aquimarina]|uniref:Putative HTH-type transcriptional regulator YdfH n=1 Tax=Marinomonas aquimarina TaxID=295068 RepID=A0A1A8TE72_9GAMM|nr:GntR family transcriptional regulator [Marinomonas aquimarina]SBS31219.1 putative HTH-type transcriptional regulator YdfH [Marinomonas aquimarina]
MTELLDQLKADILNGQLARGCPLRQQELSERYGVSRIPVRDAIAVLKNQGWLVAHGKAGVMVPELNWCEAEDLYQMRTLLECQLLDYAIPNITYEVLGKARDINKQLNSPTLSLVERGQLNWDLHATLYQVANRPTLFNVVAILNEQVRRYMGFQYGPLNYRDISQNEHEQLLNFLTDGNANEALALLKRHIDEAGKKLVAYLKATS